MANKHFTLTLRDDYSYIYERNHHIDVFLRGRKREIEQYLLQFESSLVEADYAALSEQRTVGGRYTSTLQTGKHEPYAIPRKYERRLKLLEYYNQTRLVRDIHMANLAQEIRVQGADYLEERLLDVDGAGKHYTRELTDIMKGLLAHGEYGVLLDADDETGTTYHVQYTSSCILGMERFHRGDHRGEWKELWLIDGVEKDRSGKKVLRVLQLETDADDKPYRYKWWLSTEEKSKINWFSVKELTLAPKPDVENMPGEGLGSVPYIPFVLFKDDEESPVLEAVQQLSYIRLNKASAKDNIEYYQSFQRLIGHNIEPQAFMILAEDGITSYVPSPGQPAGSVQVIEPGDGTMLAKSIDALDARIIKQGLKQIHTLSELSREVQSAESKARDADTRHEYYDTLLSDYERNYERLLYWQAEMEGINASEISVSTTRNYRSSETEIGILQRQQAASLATQLGAVDVLKTLLKQYVGELRGVSEDEKEELYDIIDTSGITGTSGNIAATIDNNELLGIGDDIEVE